MKRLGVILFFFGMLTTCFSADLISIQPITDQIVCLVFDEGNIDYFSIGQDRYNGNKLYYEQLDVEQAMQPANYSITSSKDPNYAAAQTPTAIGRKARGMEFHHIYDSNNPAALLNHWIYLELPSPLQPNADYTFHLDEIASNVKRRTLYFDCSQERSPVIHVNQIGFVPNAPKYAYLSQFMGDFNAGEHQNGALDLSGFDGEQFQLVNTADNEAVFAGTIAFHKSKSNADFKTSRGFTDENMTRADIYECDFSEFTTPGRYKVVVPRMGCSFPFEIAEDVYREPYYATSRAMFYQRAGIIQEIEPGFHYPRDQHPDDGAKMYWFPTLRAEDAFDINNAKGQIDGIWGWYHDAGDWDGYEHHYRVPMTLLALYDLKPENFGDGDVSQNFKLSDESEWIRQGENGIPDVLDEAAWLVQFYKRAKDQLIAQGYSDGGVPGYVGVDAGADYPSWTDQRDLSLKGAEMVPMTYRYAACAAWLAVCLNKSNQGQEHPQSPGWIQEARDAYAWAESKEQDDEKSVYQAKNEAAAALFRATAEPVYQDDFKTTQQMDSDWGKSKLWFAINPWHFAATIFGLTSDEHANLDASLKQSCIAAICNRADAELVRTADLHGFRFGTDDDINFMLGVFSTPRIFTAAVAFEFTQEQKYLDVCYSSCDYTLGGNQLDLVKITGVGDNPEPHVFHPDSWFLIDYNSSVFSNPPLPGYVSYEMHKNGDWMSGNKGDIGNGWSWIGDEDFSRSTAYPHIDSFPDSEARFHNRNSIAGSEWTIHQNLNQAIFAYGYLCSTHAGAYSPNPVPSVTLNLQEDVRIPIDSVLTLSVQASEGVDRVEYYYNWQYIGESRARDNNFIFEWNLDDYYLRRGSKTITAKAFDKDGQVSRPEEGGSIRIRLLDATAVESRGAHVYTFDLCQNYPNPFNPITKIEYELAEATHVKLSIYDVNGRQLVSLVDKLQAPGKYFSTWEAKNVASGIYFYDLVTDSFSARKKCLLVR